MTAITTSVKIGEAHFARFQACEMTLTNLQAKMKAASAGGKSEEAQAVAACEAISHSTAFDSASDSVSYLEVLQAAISDVGAKIAVIRKAYDDSRLDL
jgi:hypothetical protein